MNLSFYRGTASRSRKSRQYQFSKDGSDARAPVWRHPTRAAVHDLSGLAEPMQLLSSGIEVEMSEDGLQLVLQVWGALKLPARLDVVATAKLLGFTEHEIPILTAAGKMCPLGDPAPNAPKWFAAVEIVRLASDKEWLHKATKEETIDCPLCRFALRHLGGQYLFGGSARHPTQTNVLHE